MAEITTIGVFETPERAQAAVAALRDAGFDPTQIGVVYRDDRTRGKPDGSSGLALDPTDRQWEEGAGIGAATGALTGAGWGLALTTGLIPGVGPVVAGGALLAVLASTSAGAAAGTMLGALLGLGIPENDAEYYQSAFSGGHALVSVRSGERSREAAKILEDHGALTHIQESSRR